MSEIKSERQAIEAIDNGIEPYYIPEEFMKLESVILAAVKKDGEYLQYANVQTFEICLAAFQNAGHDVLYFVDKEFRTIAFLKACGIDVENYNNEETFETVDNDDWNNSYPFGIIYICGKGNPDWLSAAQKMFKRSIDPRSAEWDVSDWYSNPFYAEKYKNIFSDDNSYFEMELCCNGKINFDLTDIEQDIFDCFYDKSLLYSKKLEIFLYTVWESETEHGCGYKILGPLDDDGYMTRETKDLTFEFGDYEESNASSEINNYYFDNVIKKRRDLWLVEDKGDQNALKISKKTFVSAEKKAKEFEKSWQLSE